MGLNLGHVVGEFQQFAAMIQTDKDTFVLPTTTDFMKVIDTEFGVMKPNEPRDDALEGLDDYETTEGKREVSVTINRFMTPSGSLGVAPAESVLLRAMMGAAPTGVGGGVSVIYPLGTGNVALSLMRRYNSYAPTLMEYIVGFALEEGKFTLAGAEKPRWSFSGPAINHLATGNGQVNGTVTSSTTVPVNAPTGWINTTKVGRGFDIGGRVQIGALTNGGVGYAIAGPRADAQIVLGTSGSFANLDAVIPYCPSPTHVGSPLGHTVGSLTVDTLAWPITALEGTVKRNLAIVNDEALAAGMTDAIVQRRNITGKVTVRARADFVNELSRRKDVETRALLVTIGGTAGRIIEISMPRILPDVDKITVGQNGPGTFEIPFRALAASDGATGALVITYK